MRLQTLAVAWRYTDGLVSHTLPLGDLGETGEELEEDKSLQNSGRGLREECKLERVGAG